MKSKIENEILAKISELSAFELVEYYHEIPLKHKTEAVLQAFFEKSPKDMSEYLLSEPYTLLSESLCLSILTFRSSLFNQIPKECITEALCEIAFHDYPNLVEYVPHSALTEAIAKIAVRRSGTAIKYIPTEFITDDLCKLAVDQDFEAAYHLPPSRLTDDFCAYLVTHEKVDIHQMNCFIKNEAIALLALKFNPYCHNEIPDELWNDQLYHVMVSQCGKLLSEVPDEDRTEELCLRAIENSGEALEYFPSPLINEENCLKAFNTSHEAIAYMPDEFKTEAMCIQAVAHEGELFRHVPTSLQTHDVWMEKIKTDPSSFAFLPHKQEGFITPVMAKLAVKLLPANIKIVPEALISEELCELAMNGSSAVQRLLPDEYRTETRVLTAIKDNAGEAAYVPKRFDFIEFYTKAVEVNARVINLMPKLFFKPLDPFEPNPQLDFYCTMLRYREVDTMKGGPARIEWITNHVRNFLSLRPELNLPEIDLMDELIESLTYYNATDDLLISTWANLKEQLMKSDEELLSSIMNDLLKKDITKEALIKAYEQAESAQQKHVPKSLSL